MGSSNQRRLLMESLEKRALLAADCHNLLDPLDVNDDGLITASDAVIVIGRLNSIQHGLTDNPTLDGYVDVTDDGIVSASDAVNIINRLNDKQLTNSLPPADWVKLKGEGEARVGVRLKQADDGSVAIEVRLQNAGSGQSKEIFLDDQLIGSIRGDTRGRGSLKIDSNGGLAERMAELLMEGRQTTTLAVDSMGQVQLEKLGTKNAARSAENANLLERNVFSARLNHEGQHRGEALFAKRGEQEFFGFYARGLTPQTRYDIKIDGTIVTSVTTNSRGVIAERINTADIANFPEIKAGTVIEISNYRGEFVSLRDRIRIPTEVYVANLSGNRLFGAAELIKTNERTILGVQLGRVQADTAYDLFIDNIKIAEVKSSPRGFITFRYDSSRGDKLLAELPTLTENSVIKVGDVANGKLRKIGR